MIDLDHWKDNATLIHYLNDAEVTLENIIKKQEQISFKDWLKTQPLTCGRVL